MKPFLPLLLMATTVPLLSAQSKDCSHPNVVPADGRSITVNFEAAPQNSYVNYWYGFGAQAGHSYAVEVLPVDNEAGGTGIVIADLKVFAPGDSLVACHGTSTLAQTSISGISPAINRDGYGNGRRISLIQPASGVDLLYVTNFGGAGSLSFRVVETTLFAPHWSTFSFETWWGFMNMSDMTIQGTFNVYDTTNKLLKSAPISIPARGLVFHQTALSDLALPRNSSGYAVFAHNGPPHAVLGDAYMLNGNATVIVPAKFEPRVP